MKKEQFLKEKNRPYKEKGLDSRYLYKFYFEPAISWYLICLSSLIIMALVYHTGRVGFESYVGQKIYPHKCEI